MTYSRIPYREGLCIDCPPGTGLQPIVKNRCVRIHYNQHIRLKSAKKAAARTKDAVKRYAENKGANAPVAASLSEWFDQRRKEMTGVCCNCGNGSHKHSDVYFRFSIAHVLPKNIFKSIAVHPSNCLELCITCHTFYDRSFADAAKMPCFPLAVEKFKLFENDIAAQEQRRIPEIFYST